MEKTYTTEGEYPALFINQNGEGRSFYIVWFCISCGVDRDTECDCAKIPPPEGQKLWRRLEECKVFDSESDYKEWLISNGKDR